MFRHITIDAVNGKIKKLRNIQAVCNGNELEKKKQEEISIDYAAIFY